MTFSAMPGSTSFIRGFTIIELMIVMMIAAILMAIAVPSFDGVIRKMALDGTTSELVGTMQLARSEAIRRNAKVSLTIDPDTSKWQLLSGTNEVLRENEYSDRVAVAGGPWKLEFKASGMVSVTKGNSSQAFPTSICFSSGSDARFRQLVMIRTRLASPVSVSDQKTFASEFSAACK